MYTEDVIFDTPTLQDDGNRWSHLVAKDLPTLHNFADQLGFKRSWFEDKPGMPHYDIKTDSKRKLALSLGAIQVKRRYLFEYLKHKGFDANPLRMMYGTDYDRVGVLEPNCIQCDKCGSPCYRNRLNDVWCSNQKCNTADLKPLNEVGKGNVH